VTLHYIDVGYACFGLVVRAGVVVQAPPIAYWTLGRPIVVVRRYYEVKKKARRYETLEVA
jgi:hypothetical protein